MGHDGLMDTGGSSGSDEVRRKGSEQSGIDRAEERVLSSLSVLIEIEARERFQSVAVVAVEPRLLRVARSPFASLFPEIDTKTPSTAPRRQRL